MEIQSPVPINSGFYRKDKRKWFELEDLCVAAQKRSRGVVVRKPPSLHLSRTETDKNRLSPDIILIHKDVLSNIASFLDIKSLHNFTTTCKTCIQALRPEHVVTAALYAGGHAKTNVERIMRMVRGRRILVPSPLRLLRLCNGRLCEYCQQKRVYLISKHFGVFFCQNCLQDKGCGSTGYIKTIRRYDNLYARVSHVYAFPEGCHVLQAWARPYFASNGERCGPRLTLQCQTNPAAESDGTLKYAHQLDDKRRATLLPLMEQAFIGAVQDANARIRSIRAMKRAASKIAQDKKVRRIKRALDLLDMELGEVPWKKKLLTCKWVDVRGKSRIEFVAPLAKEILVHDMATPSRLTGPRIRRLAVVLAQAAALFEELRLHNFSFFCDAFPEERTFKEVCRDVFPHYDLLLKPWVNLHTLCRLRYHSPPDRVRALTHWLYHQLAVEGCSDGESHA